MHYYDSLNYLQILERGQGHITVGVSSKCKYYKTSCSLVKPHLHVCVM